MLHANERDIGPLEAMPTVGYQHDDTIGIVYQKKEGSFVLHHGEEYGPYTLRIIPDSLITESNATNWSVKGTDAKNQEIALINGKLSDQHSYIPYAFHSGPNTMISYEENGKFFVRVNTTVYGPYDIVYDEYAAPFQWTFKYEQGDTRMVVVNGREYPDGQYVFMNETSWMTTPQKNGKAYVQVGIFQR
ncbi:hypothetical protein HY621_00385 [Candidatus Uhrbacteria bacterium]|nr:hypothetical protein [Candidatus Uhrbacteria bacterium]